MKTSNAILIPSGLLVGALLLAVAGCSSPGYQKGEQTAQGLKDTASLINGLQGQIDSTLASMNTLMSKPQPDLKPQFETFSSDVSALESSGKSIGEARRAMGAKGKEFFAKWDEEAAKINNEDIKSRSEDRKQEVKKNLTAVRLSYTQAARDFMPFLKNLQDLRTALSVDLTAGGLNSLKPTADKATASAVPLKASVAKLAADFKALGVSMSATAPPPAK
jgi:outer membrane murein-binding lipoprotein Lpp